MSAEWTVEELRRIAWRQAFVQRLNDTIRPLGDPERILRETCRLLGEHLQVNRVSYGDIQGDDCVIVGEYVDGMPPQPGRFPWRRLGGSRTADILKGAILAVNDTSTDAHSPEERAALQAMGIGAYICPLLIKDGRFVAAFGIHSRQPREWTPDEIALVQEVADRIWATLEQGKAEADLRANQERLAFLLRLNDALRPLSDPKAVQETAAKLLAEYLGAARVGYAELDGREYVIHSEHARGVAPLIGGPLRISVGASLRDSMQRGETLVVNDVLTDARLGDEERASFQARQIAAFIGVTLFKDGRMVAAFGANQPTPRVWTPLEVELVRDVAERTWDAVERTRAQAGIRAQEERLRLAIEASGGGSWTWIAATNQADWDDRFRALYGFSADEPPSSDAWLPLVHEDDRPQVLALLADLMQSRTKNAWEHTFRLVRRDGTTAWIQSRGRAERDADGNLTRLTGLDLDFSQHRRTEEAQQLRRDEEHDRALRTLLETATQGIVSVDAHGVIVSANRAFEAMFASAPGELIGQPIAPLIPSLLCDGRTRIGVEDFVAARKDGSSFPVEVSVNHVPTPGGGRTFAFVTDITERRRAAIALRERTNELEYRTTQLSRMAWDLTLAEHHARERIASTLHDGLQQLLVIVSLNLEQRLKHDEESGAAPDGPLAEAKHHVDEAIAAARSLHLELFPPVLQRSGLPAALKWLANWTRDKYKLDVEISVDPNADSPRKDVRTLLFESVRELLFNAVKHARADRVVLESALRADDHLCITVTDDGAGFEPSTLDDRSKSGQVGWGLFSIRERLTLLGGHLDIDSAPGRGTRARLVAPRGSAQDSAAGTIESFRTRTEPAPVTGDNRSYADALRILIVDDHDAVRSALRKTLHERPQFLVVGEATNGFEAIAQAHTLGPDVILMDISMPHMDGVQATTRIRAELPEIKVLALSMHTRSDVVHAIEHAGAAGFFVKGVGTQRLIDHLLSLYESRVTRVRIES